MLTQFFLLLLQLVSFLSFTSAYADTDTITWGGDVSRTGYQK
jgi:hypothetical protein